MHIKKIPVKIIIEIYQKYFLDELCEVNEFDDIDIE